MHKMIATVDLYKARQKGWTLVKSFGKDVLVFKEDIQLDEQERENATKKTTFRGG